MAEKPIAPLGWGVGCCFRESHFENISGSGSDEAGLTKETPGAETPLFPAALGVEFSWVCLFLGDK